MRLDGGSDKNVDIWGMTRYCIEHSVPQRVISGTSAGSLKICSGPEKDLKNCLYLSIFFKKTHSLTFRLLFKNTISLSF